MNKNNAKSNNNNNDSLHQTVNMSLNTITVMEKCFNCGVIGSSPLLIASPDCLHYTPRSKPDKTAYLKKCIAEHEEQYNCFIPCEVYKAFKHLQLCFIRMFRNKQKISVRYTLCHIAQLYGHPYPKTAFINIELPKTRERYEQICDQVLKEI